MKRAAEGQPLLDSGSSEGESMAGKTGSGRLMFRDRHAYGNPRQIREIKPDYDCSPDLCKALATITFVLTTLGGAAVVGCGVTALSNPEYTPHGIFDYAPELEPLTKAMTGVGGILVVLSLMGCITVVSDTKACIIWHSVLHFTCMIAQAIIAGITLFVRSEVEDWTKINISEGCKYCDDDFHIAFNMVTPAAGFLLGCLALQGFALYLMYLRKKQLDKVHYLGHNQAVVAAQDVHLSDENLPIRNSKLGSALPVSIKVIPPTPDVHTAKCRLKKSDHLAKSAEANAEKLSGSHEY